MKLIGLVGTNSNRSTNRQLLQYMEKHFSDKASIELIEIKDIPMFNKPADKKSQTLFWKLQVKSMTLMVSSLELRNTTIPFRQY